MPKLHFLYHFRHSYSILENFVRPKTNSRQDGTGHEMNINSVEEFYFFGIGHKQQFSDLHKKIP